jgi:hypothetical protein
MPKAKASVAKEVVRVSMNDQYGGWESFLGSKAILPELGKFYLLLALEDEDMLKKHSEQLAEKMLNYLVVSCAGEARHLFSYCSGTATSLNPTAQGFIKGMKESNENGGYSASRDNMWRTGYSLAKKFGYDEILKALEQIFGELNWKSDGYGGDAWAKIARHAHMYASKDINAIIFIDGIMAIAHNGGWAYNKYYSGSIGAYTFDTFLDFKRKASEKTIWKLLEGLKIEEWSDVGKALWAEGKKHIMGLKTPLEKDKEINDYYAKKKAEQVAAKKKAADAKVQFTKSGGSGSILLNDHENPIPSGKGIKFQKPKPLSMPPSIKPKTKKGKTVEQNWKEGLYTEAYKKELVSFSKSGLSLTPNEKQILKLVLAENAAKKNKPF